MNRLKTKYVACGLTNHLTVEAYTNGNHIYLIPTIQIVRYREACNVSAEILIRLFVVTLGIIIRKSL